MEINAYLLSRPVFGNSSQEFLLAFLASGEAIWKVASTATEAERLVEFAGRVCYMSFGSKQSSRTTTEYIHNLIRNGHESVLEHAVWTVALLGVSRAFTHQLVRHRVGFAFSQLSQQYHDESDTRFVRPFGIDRVPEAATAWDKSMRDSQVAYQRIIKSLAAADQVATSTHQRESTRALRSAARSVLPNATETAIVLTVNARALRHFLKIRGGIVGDAEMREVASKLLSLINPEAPAMFSDFAIEQLSDEIPLVVHRPLSQ